MVKIILTMLMTRNNYSVQKYVSILKAKCTGIRSNLTTRIRNQRNEKASRNMERYSGKKVRRRNSPKVHLHEHGIC
jgi:hypothetical protein